MVSSGFQDPKTSKTREDAPKPQLASSHGFVRRPQGGVLRRNTAQSLSGLAPRIFFIFAPLLREEGGGGLRGEGEFL